MTEFTVLMRVAYNETWSVEAESEAEARKLIEALDDCVETDEAGECVDWDITSIRPARR